MSPLSIVIATMRNDSEMSRRCVYWYFTSLTCSLRPPSYEDLCLRRALEAARLENLTLRRSVVSFEVELARHDFFAREAAALQQRLEADELVARRLQDKLARAEEGLAARVAENRQLQQEKQAVVAESGARQADLAEARQALQQLQAKAQQNALQLRLEKERQNKANSSFLGLF